MQAFALILVLVTFFSVMWGSASALIKWGLRSFRQKAIAPVSRLDGILLLTGAAGVICFSYALFVEPFWPEVTHATLYSSKIPAGSPGFRLVHISDVHCDPTPRLEQRLPALIAQERPDLITFSGDSINSRAGTSLCKELFSKLSTIAPTYVVRGNWDSWYWSDVDLFGGTGVVTLDGKPQSLDVHGAPVSVNGLPVSKKSALPEGGEPGLEKALNMVPKDRFSIFVYHFPDIIEPVSAHQIDLYVAGHTHGGQVRLPFYGAVITLSKYGKRYEAGLYQVGRTNLYVNRGVGMEGGYAPRIRFLCRPEITVIDVKPLPVAP